MGSSELTRVLGRRPGVGTAKAVLVAGQVAARRVRPQPSPDGLRILYWHRVAEARDPLAISPAAFRRQLDAIEASRVPIVDLYNLDDASLTAGERPLALTFDDGYHDVLEHAIPELERRGWPATVFVVPGAINGELEFDWYPIGQMPRLIGWDEMRTVESRGLVRFEPHSVTHPVLPRVGPERAKREIIDSKAAVELELGREARVFCYPAGYFSDRDVNLVREAGYRCAVTCEFGVNEAPLARPFMLRRTIVEPSDPLWVFSGRLRGATDVPPIGRRSRYIQPRA